MSNFGLISEFLPADATGELGRTVYITHQVTDSTNNQPMTNQLFDHVYSQGHNNLNGYGQITSIWANNTNILSQVNTKLGTGFVPGDSVTDYSLGLILKNGLAGIAWTRAEVTDYSADELLYFRSFWSKLDSTFWGDSGIPPFKTLIDGIDINTYVFKAENFANASVTGLSSASTINLFFVRNQPPWPTYAPYTDGFVLKDINNWTTSNTNATAQNLGSGTDYPSLLYHRTGISPVIPDGAVSLFVFYGESTGTETGTGDQVVTATGAPLEITPKLNINYLIV